MLARRFLQYLLAVARHWVTLMLGIISSALFSIPEWLYPFLNTEQQAYLNQLLSIASVAASTWALSLLFLAVFIATFLAWKEEREARESAERASPEALRNELHILQSSLAQQQAREWQPLTQVQKRRLRELTTKREIFPPAKRKVRIVSLTLTDCIDLAAALYGIFHAAGWEVETGYSQEPHMHTRRGIGIYHPTGNPYVNPLISALQESLQYPLKFFWTQEEKEPPPGWPRLGQQPLPHELTIFVSRKPRQLFTSDFPNFR